jgi:cytochrome c oxidase subunit 2
MSADPAASAATKSRPPEPNHGRRIAVIWFLLAAVATPVVVLVWGPHMPPGGVTLQAEHQQAINTILAAIVTPVVLAILVYGIYALTVFRDRDQGDAQAEGPPIRGDRRITTAWIAVTVAIVVFGVSYGTYDWIGPGVGSGSGQGPDPIARPAGGKSLEVQVIGQQWQFTFRYPSYGGLQTQQLVIPSGRYIEFHVTSLDVIHSFWAVELGVKADAVPGADNVVYVRPNRVGPFRIRCAELCGLWHGQMYQLTARVATEAGFKAWIEEQKGLYSDIVRYLPPYAHVYFPDPQYRAG